jgi:hypothetical protein
VDGGGKSAKLFLEPADASHNVPLLTTNETILPPISALAKWKNDQLLENVRKREGDREMLA